MRNKKFFLLIPTWLAGIALASAIDASEAISHGGGLNTQGCHDNRETGNGHCHRSSSSQGESSNSIMKIEVTPSQSQSKKGVVTIASCYDGDTCTTTEGEKIRLACIDTPELRGSRANPEAAKIARDFLNDLVAGNEVEIRRITKDRYNRTVAELSITGINVQQLMITKGHATIYKRYADPCPWTN
ncbi:thermonuclease family protein [Prochlorococcus marinus]|uniref:Micrococcal nuclease (Thermonuclease)-like protein n=1 Tax=Prochlorococcus marinus (strain MIT 9211) TaxID=93059 RepID=A9B9M6_PROM4|nr:thermonuclease family protein [Prochlorococcus marinus]ABX08538.1 Micrococcal nuclease (thermonuclease)-like protein [Prochlorococcus marinus str. MIT 9211]